VYKLCAVLSRKRAGVTYKTPFTSKFHKRTFGIGF